MYARQWFSPPRVVRLGWLPYSEVIRAFNMTWLIVVSATLALLECRVDELELSHGSCPLSRPRAHCPLAAVPLDRSFDGTRNAAADAECGWFTWTWWRRTTAMARRVQV